MILASFLIASLVLVAFPGIDIHVSRIFFDHGFHERWWQVLLHEGLGYGLALSMVCVAAIYVFNRSFKRDVCGIDGRKICFLTLVLILGAGLIVNAGFKDHFGRARPRDVTEFGGSKQFTPAYVFSRQCDKNCSFSSGEGAGGFFSLALALALSRKRRVLAAAIGFGVLVSLSRIASGAHFLSDVVVSFFVMLIVTDVLRHYLLPGTADLAHAGPARDAAASITVAV